MHKQQAYEMCKHHLNQMVMVQTKDGHMIQGMIAHVDHEHVYLMTNPYADHNQSPALQAAAMQPQADQRPFMTDEQGTPQSGTGDRQPYGGGYGGGYGYPYGGYGGYDGGFGPYGGGYGYGGYPYGYGYYNPYAYVLPLAALTALAVTPFFFI
ncbi:hypothetical protein [Marinicrinis sediminis]|uniref:Uncharacterized protein n=1 Tax=Marinicrinis sediminis TaxID=1652465 RepID=A0ABW5RC63_9BACL